MASLSRLQNFNVSRKLNLFDYKLGKLAGTRPELAGAVLKAKLAMLDAVTTAEPKTSNARSPYGEQAQVGFT